MKRILAFFAFLAVSVAAFAECDIACFSFPTFTLGHTTDFNISCSGGQWNDQQPVFAAFTTGAVSVWITNDPNPNNMNFDVGMSIQEDTLNYMPVTWHNVAPRPGNIFNWRGDLNVRAGHTYNVQSAGACWGRVNLTYTAG